MRIKILLIIIIIFGTILVVPTIINTASAAASDTREGARHELEEEILSTTVRILVESWVVRPDETGYDIHATLGHGTVMAGRYLVTHNHFSVPLSILQLQEDTGSYAVVYIYSSQGELLNKGPLTNFELAQNDVETLVFVHKQEGFFEELGFASAEFAAWPSLGLEPGMEVAQVDWDGLTARVDWVEVQSVILEDGAPRIVLDDSVLSGASGGGIFWKGSHVANNWRLEERIDATGTVVEAVTAAALNSVEISNLQMRRQIGS